MGDTDDGTRRVKQEKRPGPLVAFVRLRGPDGSAGSLRLTTAPSVIGTGSDCDLVVSDRTVSRRHVELSLVPEGVLVRDLDSRNGTFYLGQRVERIVLNIGAQLMLGGEGLTVDLHLDDAVLANELHYEEDEYHNMLGTAPAMKRLFALLSRLEGSLATVLIEGESGVGKQLVAEAIHAGSSRASGPLDTVNCGAIPKDLIGTELFGHKRGAFTGAYESRKGAFERARSGTLFLDEIAELPLELQPALLRVLESRVFRPVGGEQDLPTDARIIAATNRDLEVEVAAGGFREDLFYRLAVVRLEVPALAERRQDVPRLAQKFARDFELDALPAEILGELERREYPGNVRELRNVVQGYAALGVLPRKNRSQAQVLDLALAAAVDTSSSYAAQKELIVDVFTRHYLVELMKQTGGNQSAAARIAGLDRTHLGRLLAKFGLRPRS